MVFRKRLSETDFSRSKTLSRWLKLLEKPERRVELSRAFEEAEVRIAYTQSEACHNCTVGFPFLGGADPCATEVTRIVGKLSEKG